MALRHAIARAAAAAGVVIVALPAPAAATPAGASGPAMATDSCRIKELALPPAPPGSSSGVNAGDATGRWLVGWVGDPSGEGTQPVIWHHGRPTVPQVPLDNVSLRGVNRRGVAVGTGVAGGTSGEIADARVRTVAFALVDGRYVRLATPAGALDARASGISNSGRISGWADPAGGLPFPVAWSLDAPDEPVRLPLPPDMFGYAVDVSAKGTIAVTAESTAEFELRSFLYSRGGNRTELTGVHRNSQVDVGAVANGWALSTETEPTGGHLVRHDLVADRDEVVEIPGIEWVLELNHDGIIGGRDLEGGLLYTDHLVRLPPLPGGSAGVPSTIDNDGNPAGYADSADFTGAAVRWRCHLD